MIMRVKKMRVILIMFCIPHFQIQNRRLPTRVVLGQRDTLSLRPEKTDNDRKIEEKNKKCMVFDRNVKRWKIRNTKGIK